MYASNKGSSRQPSSRHPGSASDYRKYHHHHPREAMDVDLPIANGVSSNGTDEGSDFTLVSERFNDYPSRKPFIHSDYTRNKVDREKSSAYPTHDRDAVISALKNLQDKVKKLEIERVTAEHNLEALSSQTDQYKDMLSSSSCPPQSKFTSTSQPAKRPAKSSTSYSTSTSYFPANWSKEGNTKGETYVNNQSKELEGQLTAAETRCQMLEKQLDYMRNMVDNSEKDRRHLMEKTLKSQQERHLMGSDLKQHLNRLAELERDQHKLTNTQTLAESKIKELEDRVKREKLHRKTLQGRTSELETVCRKKSPSADTESLSSPTEPKPSAPVIKTKKLTAKKKKKKVSVPTKRPKSQCKSEPMKHYRLNLAEIPFVAGKSTTASHSLGANVQKVLAMMKSHNSALCSQVHANGDAQRSTSPSGSSDSSGYQDFTDLIRQLQDEFGQLSSEHQETMQRLHVCVDKEERGDIEQELEILVSRLEAKGQQIAKVRQHQQKLEGKKPKPTPKGEKTKRPQSAGGRMLTSGNHHHHHNHHTNNHRHHQHNNHSSQQNGHSSSQPHSSNKPIGNSALGNPALFMLRDMKKLQTTLRRDDLTWD